MSGVVYDLRIGLRSTLTQMIIMSVVLGMAGAAYFIGYGQMRYSAVPPDEPIQFFPFWHFFITGYFPFVVYMLVVYLLFTSALRQRRPARVLPHIISIICMIAIAWSLIFVIWQATVWANCNDGGNTLIPAHPECINRKYPQIQSADWTFIIQVIAGGILAVPSAIGWWLAQQVINTELAAYTLATSSDEYIGEEMDSSDDIECHRKKKSKKSKKSKKRKNASRQPQQPVSDIGSQLTSIDSDSD